MLPIKLFDRKLKTLFPYSFFPPKDSLSSKLLHKSQITSMVSTTSLWYQQKEELFFFSLGHVLSIVLSAKSPTGENPTRDEGSWTPRKVGSGQEQLPISKALWGHPWGDGGSPSQQSRRGHTWVKPSQRVSTWVRAAGKGRGWVFCVVTAKEQGPKRNWRNHSVRQGFSCTGKLEPLWVEGRSGGHANSKHLPKATKRHPCAIAVLKFHRQYGKTDRKHLPAYTVVPPPFLYHTTVCYHELKDQPFSPGWDMSVHQLHQEHQTWGKGLVRDHHLKSDLGEKGHPPVGSTSHTCVVKCIQRAQQSSCS